MTVGKWLNVALLSLSLAAGCSALRDDLGRAEAAFDAAKYDDVEVWLHSLESDLPHMDRAMRARFYYLRGTTAYRLDDKRAARHYLALAREEAAADESALRLAWRKDMARMLDELTHPKTESPTDEEQAPGDGETVPALTM